MKPLGDDRLWSVVDVLKIFPSRSRYTDPRSLLVVYATYEDADRSTDDSCTRDRFEEAAFGEPFGWTQIVTRSTYGIMTFAREDYYWVRRSLC